MLLIRFIKGVYRIFQPNYTASVSSLFFILLQSSCILLLYQLLYRVSIYGKLINPNKIDLFIINDMYPVTRILSFLFIIICISYIVALLISTVSRTGKFHSELHSLNEIKSINFIFNIINVYIGCSATSILLIIIPIRLIIEQGVPVSIVHTVINVGLYLLLILYSILITHLVISSYILDLKINR